MEKYNTTEDRLIRLMMKSDLPPEVVMQAVIKMAKVIREEKNRLSEGDKPEEEPNI